MNRFITTLPKTLIAAAAPLFQAALPLTVANLGPARASRRHGTIVKMIRRGPQAAAIAIRPAKILMIGHQPWRSSDDAEFRPSLATRQLRSTAREQALRECSFIERRDTHDPQEGTKTGSRQFVYKACMADHGRRE